MKARTAVATYEAVAARLGISPSDVRKIERQALKKLRNNRDLRAAAKNYGYMREEKNDN